jgi:fatty acid desaturase
MSLKPGIISFADRRAEVVGVTVGSPSRCATTRDRRAVVFAVVVFAAVVFAAVVFAAVVFAVVVFAVVVFAAVVFAVVVFAAVVFAAVVFVDAAARGRGTRVVCLFAGAGATI